MEELILLVQKTYGLAGVLLLSPLLATIALWRANASLHKDLIKTQEQARAEVVKATETATEAQKQRVKDAQDINLKLIEVVKEQTALNTETNLALERIGDVLNELQNRMLADQTRRNDR